MELRLRIENDRICLLVNFIVFPDFAADRLNKQFRIVLAMILELSKSTFDALSGLEATREKFEAGCNPEFIEQISPAMKKSWDELWSVYSQIIREIDNKLNEDTDADLPKEVVDEESTIASSRTSDAVKRSAEVLAEFEKYQPFVLLDLFKDENKEDPLGEESFLQWEKFLQLTFYLLASREIVSTTLGATVGFVAVLAVQSSSKFGIVGFSAALALPCYYLTIFTPRYALYGILTLLSFSSYICAILANSANPAFDPYSVYLYKVIAVAACALVFSLIFSLVLYPTLARHVLRERMNAIFVQLGAFYRKILLSTVNAPHADGMLSGTPIEDRDILDTRNRIIEQLAALTPLMTYAAAEPRIEGPFPADRYRELIAGMYSLLDWLECMRVSGGSMPFDANMQEFLNYGIIGESRNDLQQTIRVLLFMYASAMMTKQRLLPTLPNATTIRGKFFRTMVLTLSNHVHHLCKEGSCPLDSFVPSKKEDIISVFNTEKWMRLFSLNSAVREVSKRLDDMGNVMKEVFGVYPDVMVRHQQQSDYWDGWLMSDFPDRQDGPQDIASEGRKAADDRQDGPPDVAPEGSLEHSPTPEGPLPDNK
ncbi:hypothetical protein HDU84_005365 [Entophlyctis sp. JEL0112]|nr:hypothetical protein HDU84_005365 [Entophlyctis sp. JEL0112]